MTWGGFSPHQPRLQWAHRRGWEELFGEWILSVVFFSCSANGAQGGTSEAAVSPIFCVLLSAQLFAGLCGFCPIAESNPYHLRPDLKGQIAPRDTNLSITSNDSVVPEHLWSPKWSNQNSLQLLTYRKPCITLAKVVQFSSFSQNRNQPPQITDLASLFGFGPGELTPSYIILLGH